MFTTHRPTLTLQLHNFDLFRTCRTALLRGSWHDFNWHDASRGPSVIAELLVMFGSCQYWAKRWLGRSSQKSVVLCQVGHKTLLSRSCCWWLLYEVLLLISTVLLPPCDCPRLRLCLTMVHVVKCLYVCMHAQVCREQFVSLHTQPVLSELSQSLLDRYGYSASDIRYSPSTFHYFHHY